MRVAILGGGLQARRRAGAILASKQDSLVAIAAENMTAFHCEHVLDWRDVVQRSDVDAVIVCTPPYLHAEATIAALRAGKHVLCEKPLARTLAEAEEMVAVAATTSQVFKCGYNHRHFPGFQQAKRWLEEGLIGNIVCMRCRYGIGGRPKLEKEWRSNPALVGGGQLMEQGIHAIDLFRWFAGEFSDVACFAETTCFPIAPLEDNAVVILRTVSGQIASLYSGLTQWKNLFSFEILGTCGYVTVEGLGGAYGTHKVTLGYRAASLPFRDETIEYRGEDKSWINEWREFSDAVREQRQPVGDGADGVAGMRVVFAAYEASQQRKVVSLHV